MCWGHLKRAQRGRPLERELGAPRGGKHGRWDRSVMLKDAAIRLANAEGDDEWQRAWEHLCEVACEFVLGTRRGSRQARRALAHAAPNR
jgi:hypothetical protein